MKVPEIKVTYSHHIPASQRIKITSSQSAFDIARELYNPDTIEHVESAYVILLDNSCRVLGQALLSIGGTTATIIDTKLVFQIALKTNSRQIILVHNHPSGNLMPSENDIKVTRQIDRVGKDLGITLVDHIIVVPEGKYYSFSDSGNL